MKPMVVIAKLILIALLLTISTTAQTQLAATLEVLDPSVEVLRVNTANPIAVSVEAIVGVGDTIYTGENGRARITFFSDGTSVELEPNTEYVINEFSSEGDSFQLRTSVLIGRATHQLARILDASSAYEIETPGMTLAARGTEFTIRVEDTGRSAMLVHEGNVDANAEDESEDVANGYGCSF